MRKIQHDCLICLGSEQPSCFSCLIILGYKFQKSWATTQNFWSGYKAGAVFHHMSQFYEVWTWDIKNFSDQADKEYVQFWDVKSVSKQAAYYMEWRSPRKWQYIHPSTFWQLYVFWGGIHILVNLVQQDNISCRSSIYSNVGTFIMLCHLTCDWGKFSYHWASLDIFCTQFSR